MEIRLDTTQKAQPQFQTNHTSQLIDQRQYESRLVSGKDSKPVELFWKGWGYVKSAAFVVYDYILWALRCFPSIPSKLEAVEQMIDNPKEKAAECKKTPVPFLANVFQAALMDPDGLEELRKEEGYGEFLRALNGGFAKTVFEGLKREPLAALTALMNPFGSNVDNKVFKDLLGVLKENIPMLGDALISACERVKDKMGASDNDKLNALRAIFGKYLPSVGEIAKKSPKAFQAFLDDLYKLNQIDESIIGLMTKHFPSKEQPSKEDIANLKLCLERNGLALSQLGHSSLAKSQLGADNNVDLSMAFFQGLLQNAKPEVIGKLADLIKDHEVLAGFGNAIKDIASDSRNLQRAADNLPRAIELMKAIKTDYEKPPAAPKKEEKK